MSLALVRCNLLMSQNPSELVDVTTMTGLMRTVMEEKSLSSGLTHRVHEHCDWADAHVASGNDSEARTFMVQGYDLLYLAVKMAL